jgi:hypothetical protein
MTHHLRTMLLTAALLPLAALARAQAPPEAEAPPMPPTPPGREVVIDSRTMVTDRKEISLSDLDPETAEIVHEVNSKPGTWQLYLLYTAEDLPEIMFHPGFAIRLPSKPKPAPPPPAVEPVPTGASQGAAPAAKAPASRPAAAPAGTTSPRR